MTKEEQIKKLSEELLMLIGTPDTTPSETDLYNKTIYDLKNGLNVEVDVVKKIMKRVDEVYGKCENYNYTAPLYEEFSKITKE